MVSTDIQPPMVSKKVWLTYTSRVQVEQPLLWRMSRAFPGVSFDIRQASVQEHLGIMAVLLNGEAREVDEAIHFLQQSGVKVDPIEKTVIEG
jgi:ABC-type methionine transport system ATPase subunit